MKLDSISKYLTHKLGNSSDKMKDQVETIKELHDDIDNYLQEEHLDAQEADVIDTKTELSMTEHGQKSNEISKQVQNVIKQIEIITKYKKRTVHFIELARNQTELSPRITNVNEFAKQLIEQIKTENEKIHLYNIRIEEVYDPSLKSIQVDRTNLEIILDNLVENASDAIEANSERQKDYNPWIKIQTKKSKNSIQISVQDNGIGMTPQRQCMIFGAFVSFKMDQGIGLSLIKDILELEQGNIKVESTLGKGSKFTIILPIKRK